MDFPFLSHLVQVYISEEAKCGSREMAQDFNGANTYGFRGVQSPEERPEDGKDVLLVA